jgi:hypothetical protein
LQLLLEQEELAPSFFTMRQCCLNFMQMGLILGSALTMARQSLHLFSGLASEESLAIAAALALQKS